SANETAAAEKIGSAGTAPQGSGTLIIEAPAIVEFQLDHGRWQTAGKQPISVAAGPHELLSLSGMQTIELKDKQTLTVQVPESQIGKLSSSGFDAFEKKDLRKSQKLLEKANALCGRERKHVQPCNDLGVEINYHLGQIYETQEHPSDAMTAYQ